MVTVATRAVGGPKHMPIVYLGLRAASMSCKAWGKHDVAFDEGSSWLLWMSRTSLWWVFLNLPAISVTLLEHWLEMREERQAWHNLEISFLFLFTIIFAFQQFGCTLPTYTSVLLITLSLSHVLSLPLGPWLAPLYLLHYSLKHRTLIRQIWHTCRSLSLTVLFPALSFIHKLALDYVSACTISSCDVYVFLTQLMSQHINPSAHIAYSCHLMQHVRGRVLLCVMHVKIILTPAVKLTLINFIKDK